ncbi:MAG: DUF2244 domain-containing protein [Rubellimicrobium sp.]|nr:DUF2244 domain-containing protein [Rubellimicrobium sp.]
MPYRWTEPASPDDPPARLRLWPHQSLDRRGFALFFGLTAALVAMPLLALVGSAALWGVLPFAGLAFWGTWAAVRRQARDAARVSEELSLWPDRIVLVHVPAQGPAVAWEANPHWVRLTLHARGGPVPDYLTLGSGGREVELGAFLSEEERRSLHEDLSRRLARLALRP